VRFVARHSELIRRAAQFQVMATDEKAGILRRARALQGEHLRSMHAVSKQIAAETGRAMETIRLLLQKFDSENPDQALFGREAAPADPTTAEATVAAFRSGESIESIAERTGRTSECVEAALHKARVAELMQTPIDYVYSAEYDDPQARRTILCGSNG